MSTAVPTIEAIEQEVAAHRQAYPQSRIRFLPEWQAVPAQLAPRLQAQALGEVQRAVREQMYMETLVFRDTVPFEKARYLAQQKFRPGTVCVVHPSDGPPYCAACKTRLAVTNDRLDTTHDCPGWRDEAPTTPA